MSKEVDGLVASSSSTGALQPPKQREGGQKGVMFPPATNEPYEAQRSSALKPKSPVQVHLVSCRLLGCIHLALMRDSPTLSMTVAAGASWWEKAGMALNFICFC